MGLAKTTRPRQRGVFPRKRLFRFLDPKLGPPITWVLGPPGSGKTTLVSSYVETQKLACLWYHLDEGDGDIASFFYHLADAAPKGRRRLPLLTPEYLPNISIFTQGFFRELCGRYRRPFAIVLDDYHDVPQESDFHRVLQFALGEIPETGQVTIISRNGPPAEFARLRANRALRIISGAELKLTFAETKGLVQYIAHQRLSPRLVRELHESVDGWVAGLVLLLERRRAEKNTLSASSNRDPQEVFDYFAGEIFTKSTEEAREILLLTSYFPRFTAEMANRLTETPNAGSFVDSLAQDHYFTTKHGADKPTYRYHALFREFLQSQANQVYTAERRHQVMVTAANLLRETHQFEDAVELLEQARDWPTLATVIEQCAPALAGQGRTNTLTEWLNSLPKELFPSRPWLCYWRGIARLAYQPPDARIDLERSFKSFSLSHDSPGVCLALAAILRSHVYEYQDFALIDPWLELVDKTNADFRSLDNVDIQANFIATVILAMLARRPDHTDLPMWIERAEAHVSKIPDPSRAMELLLFIGFYYYWRGDFRKGLTVAEAFRGLERSQQVGPMEQMSAMFLRARFEWQLNSVAKGTASLRKIKEIADLSGVHLLDGQLFAEFAVVSISVSDLTSAEHYLNSVNPVLTTFSNCDRFAYYLATACLELARGNLAAAVSYQEQALQAALKINMPMVVAIGRLLSASIIHKHGKCDEAREHVKLSLQSARQAEARFIEFMGLLTEAELAFDEDDHATGLTSLTKAMALGREHGYMNSFLWRPAAIAKLCAIALEADIEPEYVRRLIGEHRFPPPPSVAELEQWPWRIKVFTLGRFNVLVNDRPLEFGRKAQRKPIELLKLLVALGGRTVSELRVAEILWPEADGDMAQQSLSTTLHRLRRLLGSDDAIQRQSARLTINPRLCWVDAWALERLLSRAEEEGVSFEAVRDWANRASGLYHGGFLEDDDHGWANSLSQRLRKRLMSVLSRVARGFEEREQWGEAVRFYEKAIGVDACAELIYRRLMQCHHRLGERGEVMAVYDRCKTALDTVLQVKPSPETETAYRELRSSWTNH